jgi:uncharacterized membrane protein YfcA
MALIVYSGLQLIANTTKSVFTSSSLNQKRIYLMLIGFVTGIASTLSGTGGPLVVIPLLILAGFSPHMSVGLAQVIQIPIAVVATLAYASNGLLEFELGLTIGIGSVVGVIAGAVIAQKIEPDRYKRFLSILLLGVAIYYGYFLFA